VALSPEKPAKMPKEQPFSAEKEHDKVLTITREELMGKFHSEEETKRYFSQKALVSPTATPTPPDPSTPLSAVMETKTITRQERLEESGFELPPSYNETAVVLLVRDPYWIYAYWDFREELKAELSRTFAGWEKVPLTLRVYNLSRRQPGTGEPEFFDISINHLANNWYINVGEPDKEYQVDLGYYTLDGKFHTLARSNKVTTPRDSVSPVIDEEWMIVEEKFRRLYRLASGAGWGESSVELVESLIKRLEREAGSGVVSSISSPVGVRPRERRFWLVLDAELIVYGATEPDASLTLQGRPVNLRPDGTFTVRMALPDGTQTIPVTAVSRDGGETITITTQVTRETGQQIRGEVHPS
jgi:hypothetical protein